MFFRPFIPIFQSQPPTTFAELFGGDLAHLWDSYDDGTGVFTDSVGGFDVDDAGDNTPIEASINGHSYPVFDGGAASHGLETSTDFATLDGLDSWTIWGAFKTTDTFPYGGIVEKPGGFYVEFSSPALYVGVSNVAGNEINGTIPINDMQWHRFIITCNSGVMILYIDGVMDGTDTVIAMPSGVVNPFFIGKQFSTAAYASIALVGIATRGINFTEVGYLDGMVADYVAVTASPSISSVEDSIIDPLGAGRAQRIYGSDFVNGATVDIEGDAATSVTYVSATELTCTMPAKIIPTVPRLAATATIDTNVPVDTALGADGSVFVLFRAKERGARNVAVYANGNLITDPSNATFTLGYTNVGVHVSLYAGGYVELVYDCNVLDGLYHCVQVVFTNSSILKIRVDNGPWKSNSIGSPSYPTPSDLRIGADYSNLNRHRGEIALVAAGPIAISDGDFDNILANIHRLYGINLGVAKGQFDWTTLALELLLEPGNFDVGTGDWTGTSSAGGSGSVTATSTVVFETTFGKCFNLTVTNPDSGTGTLASAVMYWDPSAMFGVDDRGMYVDSRKGLTITSSPDIDSITDQMNGNVFSANGTKPVIVTAEFSGVTDAIRSDEIPPLLVGYEGTALIGTSKTIPATGRMATFMAVVKTTNNDITSDWYTGNQPNTIIGDRTGSIESTFGMNGDKIGYAGFRATLGGWQQKTYGNGFNDGFARPLIVAADVKDSTATAPAALPDARGFVGTQQLGYSEIGYDASLTYNTLFGSYVDGTTHAGDSFKGDTGSAVVLDLPCPVNDAELDLFERWSVQSFDAIGNLDFDPRFTGPTGLYLPNGYDATSGVWKAAVGNDLTKAGTPGPSDAGDGSPDFNFVTDWHLVDSANDGARFREWAGQNRGCHIIARVSTTNTNSWGTNAFTDAIGSIHYQNPAICKDMASWRGMSLYRDGGGGFWIQAWDFDPVLDAGDCAQIDVAALGLVDGSGVGEFIAEMKKVYDQTSDAWELWVRATSTTPGATPSQWIQGVHSHVLGDTGGGGGIQLGAITGNIKALITWRRELSEWTALKIIDFLQNINTPATIDPTSMVDCEAWWDTRSISGTIGAGGTGTATINNQSVAHPETVRNLVQTLDASNGYTDPSMAVDASYNNEQVISVSATAFDSQLFSSIVEQPIRVYYVGEITAPLNLGYWFDCTPADPQTTTRIALLDNGVGSDELYMFAGNTVTGGSGVSVPHVVCAIYNGANSELYIGDSKTPILTGVDVGALDMGSIRLFNRFSSDAPRSGKWACMGIFKGVGDYFERKRMFDLLKTRYGIA